jgi:cytidyltransferase-like protein
MAKTVFVSGSFDILHGGHVEFFEQARRLGDRLVVSVASPEVLGTYKNRNSSIPVQHKKMVIQSLRAVDEVVIGDTEINDGIDFLSHFRRIRPSILAVTEDDKFEKSKKALCAEVGCEYVVLPKTLGYEQISTTEIVEWVKAPREVPLRVDFAGGWLDVPTFARDGGFIVNCAITPKVSLTDWPYEIGAGLGGSAAYAALAGADAVDSELTAGVGWQDPAVIRETGLCVWRSGPLPVLEAKINPDILTDRLYLLWTGGGHHTPSYVETKRDYKKIFQAGQIAATGVLHKDVEMLYDAVKLSYEVQLGEGMDVLPDLGEKAKKYCGGGFGGYALYMFSTLSEAPEHLIQVQPFMVC